MFFIYLSISVYPVTIIDNVYYLIYIITMSIYFQKFEEYHHEIGIIRVYAICYMYDRLSRTQNYYYSANYIHVYSLTF